MAALEETGASAPQEWEKGKGPGSSRHLISRHRSSSTPACRAAIGHLENGLLPRGGPRAPSGVTDPGRPPRRAGEPPSSRTKVSPCPAPALLPPRPCPAAWARPIAKLSSWFVTVGLSCVRCSRVGNVVCSVVVRGRGWWGQARTPPERLGPWGTGWLQGQVAQAGPAAGPKDLGPWGRGVRVGGGDGTGCRGCGAGGSWGCWGWLARLCPLRLRVWGRGHQGFVSLCGAAEAPGSFSGNSEATSCPTSLSFILPCPSPPPSIPPPHSAPLGTRSSLCSRPAPALPCLEPVWGDTKGPPRFASPGGFGSVLSLVFITVQTGGEGLGGVISHTHLS